MKSGAKVKTIFGSKMVQSLFAEFQTTDVISGPLLHAGSKNMIS
jgi:hypothetical protein